MHPASPRRPTLAEISFARSANPLTMEIIARSQFLLLGGSELRRLHVMTELQSTDVRSDCPAVLRVNARCVGVHDAIAIRDYIEEMCDGRITQTRNMVGGRLREAALHHHAVSAAGSVMAFGTHDIETFAAPGQQLWRQLYRQLRNISSIR